MSKCLSKEAIEQFRNEGYFFPVALLSEVEVYEIRRHLETFEAEQGHPLEGGQRSHAHLLFPWLYSLVSHHKILDVVEDLVGPNILCWGSIFWTKEAHSASFVSWHQDITYWGLTNGDVVNVWVALSPSNETSGCMSVREVSHKAIKCGVYAVRTLKQSLPLWACACVPLPHYQTVIAQKVCCCLIPPCSLIRS